jgi:glycosyltransferase involved in cell wall biosynthesis
MKVLVVNKFHYLKGGCERYIFSLQDLLTGHGHEVIPFSMKDSRNEKTPYDEYFIDRVDVEKFSFKNIVKLFHNYDATRQLEKLLAATSPDIAHLHNIAHQISPAIIKVLKKRGIPVVQTLHDYKLVCPNYRLYSQGQTCRDCLGGKFYRCTSKRCVKDSLAKSALATAEAYWHKLVASYDGVDMFICPSRYMYDACQEAGVEAERLAVVPNFLANIPAYVPGDGGYLLYFGRISSEKGLNDLLTAMADPAINLPLKIVGTGPDFQKTKQAIIRQGLEGKVELLGPKYGAELESVIRAAKLVVIPSVWPENLPYSLLEAMSFGRPVVAPRLGGMPEAIIDGKTGFLYEPGSAKRLAECLIRALSANLTAVSQEAWKASLAYGPDSHYRALVAMYRRAKRNYKKKS